MQNIKKESPSLRKLSQSRALELSARETRKYCPIEGVFALCLALKNNYVK